MTPHYLRPHYRGRILEIIFGDLRRRYPDLAARYELFIERFDALTSDEARTAYLENPRIPKLPTNVPARSDEKRSALIMAVDLLLYAAKLARADVKPRPKQLHEKRNDFQMRVATKMQEEAQRLVRERTPRAHDSSQNS